MGFFFGEIRNLTTFTRLMDCNNGFSLSFFFLSVISFLWIGAQFPQEKFLSYGRIFTLHFYFLLMCILFSFLFLFIFDGFVIYNQHSSINFRSVLCGFMFVDIHLVSSGFIFFLLSH